MLSPFIGYIPIFSATDLIVDGVSFRTDVVSSCLLQAGRRSENILTRTICSVKHTTHDDSPVGIYARVAPCSKRRTEWFPSLPENSGWAARITFSSMKWDGLNATGV